MTEILEGVAFELEAAGVDVNFGVDSFPRFDSPTVYVVVPHEFFATVSPDRWPDEQQLRHTISFCVEMPGTFWFDLTYAYAAHTAAAVSINASAAHELTKRGLRTQFLQLGYTSAWDRWQGASDKERPVDVLYMGSTDTRRDAFLSSYAHELWRHRAEILVPPIEPRTKGGVGYLVGDAKYDRMASAKTLINLHRGDSRSLEWVRVLEAMSNGCVVLSEHSLDHEPLCPGEHFVSAAPESLALVADALLRDPDKLGEIRRNAYEFIRSELALSSSVPVLVELAETLITAHPQNGDRGRPSVEYLPSPPPPPGPPGASPPLDAIGREFERLRSGMYRLAIENLETRRVLQSLLTPPEGEWDVDGLRVFAATPVVEASAPRVSVLVPLYNHEREVIQALESVISSTYSNFELLVYDDSSTDRSAQVVAEFLAEHPSVPAVLLHSYLNRGPSRARNALAARARGEFVFLLDSDNKIYPPTLERLVDLLDRTPSASFAYSIIASSAAGVPYGLVSERPWDPASLRHGNYIDTMALVRRDALLSVGGFCEDIRMTTWEDYDLWCRFAEHGRRGVLLPEMLGWYRRTGVSRDGFNQIDTSGVQAFIRERSPTVFAG